MSPSRESHAPNSFRLLTLGGLTLVAPDGSVVRQQRRRLALLVLLASGGKRGVSRDKLISWLSPESTTDSARHSLNQLIYYVRQEAGESAFIGSDPLSLNPEAFSSDFSDFECAVASGSNAEAAELYKGPFLDGFHLPDSPEFDQWADAERSRLASVYSESLVRLVADATSRHDHVDAIKWARQLSYQDPLSGRAAIALMRSLEAAGDGPAALLHARGHESLVRAELGSAPDRELTAFVERLASQAPAASRNGDSHLPHPIEEIIETGKPVVIRMPAPAIVPRNRSRLRTAYRAVAGLFVVVAGVSVFLRGGENAFPWSKASSKLVTSGGQILVGDFQSEPDDSLGARALSEALRSSFVDVPALSVVPRAELDGALARMKLPITSFLDFRLARELATRNGYEAVLGGSITRMWAGYLVSAQLIKANGTELATISETALSRDLLIPAIGRLSIKLRETLGESASSLDSVRPLSEVTTGSLTALERYDQAQRADRSGQGRAPHTMTLLREAIAADSTFASAHRHLGIKLNNLGRTREGIRELRVAERFSHRLTDVERLQALSSLHMVLRDYTRSLDEAERVLELRPKSLWAFNQVAILDVLLGRFEHGREIARRRQQVDTTGFSLGPATAEFQGKVDEAITMARAVLVRNRDLKRTLLFDSGRRSLAFAHSAVPDYDSVDFYTVPIGSAVQGHPDILARGQLARGQVRKAFGTLGVRARGAETRRSHPKFSAINESLAASATAVILGDMVSASRRLDSVLADTSFLTDDAADQPIDAILALAMTGRARDARAALTRIERAADSDIRAARDPELSLASGAVALAEKRFPEAVAALQHASRTNMVSDHACRICVLPLLGRAYEAMGQPDSAVATYQRFLSTGDNIRIYPDGVWRATVLFRLGDLYAQRGDRTRAAAYFEKFVTLWKDADPELKPRVDAARRRIVELRKPATIASTPSR